MKAIIMAAGEATRTVPLTLTRPKALLPIANKPLIMHQLDALHALVDEVIVIVGYKAEMIRDALGDSYRDLKITYVEQRERKGTGHALLQCRDHIDGPFFALNGDDLYAACDFAALAAYDSGALSAEVEDPRSFGVFELNEDKTIVRLIEKPTDPPSNLANIGVYKFPPDVFEVLEHTEPSERGEIEITSAVQVLAERGPFHAVPIAGYWLPLVYSWSLLDANAYILEHLFESLIEGDVHINAEVIGPLRLGEGSVIRSGVVIEGPVSIGKNCVVGPNAYLRPGTTLGDNCKVGQACELKNTILFDGAHVPHLSYIGDTVVGSGSNLGAGTITANLRHDGVNIRTAVKGEIIDSGRRKFGAIIGDDVHTGINTSILPGRKLWPGTGTYPGQVVSKDITGEE